MRAEPLLPGAAVVRHWPSQLLMRSQGPRGPNAIDCPVRPPNQSLDTRTVGRITTIRRQGRVSLTVQGYDDSCRFTGI
jgi:hypothetical protein